MLYYQTSGVHFSLFYFFPILSAESALIFDAQLILNSHILIGIADTSKLNILNS